MKNTGKCPKCSGARIAATTLMAHIYAVSYAKTGRITNSLVSSFVCCDCGYIESYATEKNKLEKLASKQG